MVQRRARIDSLLTAMQSAQAVFDELAANAADAGYRYDETDLEPFLFAADGIIALKDDARNCCGDPNSGIMTASQLLGLKICLRTVIIRVATRSGPVF